MKMEPEYYQRLASKWLDGTITDEEKQLFSEWYASAIEEELLIPSHIASDEQELKRRIYKKIHVKIKDHQQKKDGKIFFIKRSWSVAAAILLLAFAGISYYKLNFDFSALNNAKNVAILPGRTHAILTLSDGSTVNVDSLKVGQLIEDQGLLITKNQDGEISYLLENQTNLKQNKLHRISTPKGSEIQFLLPDGSKVWLNANSSIQYALNFVTDQRAIELLQGEAYFEVKQHQVYGKKVPFVVNINRQKIEVLGTSFNVNLEDENSIRTTLVEGKIQIAISDDAKAIVLNPGEQSTLTLNTGELEVQRVNVDRFVAWKNGLFYFDDTSLEVLLEQISQWYDIEIEHNKTVEQYHFVGKIPRSTSLSTVLDILSSSGVKFKLEGRKLIVNQLN